jgi:WD40 repeat protein
MDPFLVMTSKNMVIRVQSIRETLLATSESSGIVRIFKKAKSLDGNWNINSYLGIKIPIINEETHTTAIDSSNDSSLLASYDSREKVVKVFNVAQKTIVFKIEWHQGRVDHLKFDNQNKYLATGGMDGKVCLWSSSTGKLLYTLPHYNDSVSCLEFSPSNKRFASGSYTRTVDVIDLRKMERIATLKLKHKSAIIAISFFAVTYLITLDKLGYIFVWDYKTSSFLYGLPKTKSEPIYSTVIEDEYLIVACKDSYIYLYSIEKRKLLNMRYIYSEQGIKSVSFDKKNSILFISTLNNTIDCYDLLQGKDDIKTEVLAGNYSAAYNLLYKNPILEEMEPYVKVLFEIWDDSVKEAITYLEDNQKDQAQIALDPFMEIPIKADFIQSLLLEYKDFKQFKDSIDKNNFQLAHTILIKHPTYKDSDYYKIMESEWDECVKKATLALENNSEELDKELQQIFQNFRGISEKLSFIREISDKRIALSLFNKHYIKKDYPECFKIIETYDFLTDTANYRNLLVRQDALYLHMKDSLNRSLYSQCKTYAQQLILFPAHRQEASDVLNNIGKIDTLTKLYYAKDYRPMLNLIQKYPFLDELPEVIKFHDEFESVMEIAESHAIKGNVTKILLEFKEYIPLKQLRERMGKIVSSAYIQQLRFLAKKFPNKTSAIINGINNYIDIFGADEAIIGYVSFIKETLGLELSQDYMPSSIDQENYERWVKTKLPSRIF